MHAYVGTTSHASEQFIILVTPPIKRGHGLDGALFENSERNAKKSEINKYEGPVCFKEKTSRECYLVRTLSLNFDCAPAEKVTRKSLVFFESHGTTLG